MLLIAAIMATTALGIDTMLPALPQIGRSIGVAGGNQAQWVVTGYLVGMGAAQLVYGALSDRFGRRPVLLFGVAVYAAFSLMAAAATSLEMMVFARIMQGVGAAAPRVLAVSVVRDRFSGRQMAQVLSLTFIVFLTVPIVAPGLGQLIMMALPWRALFVCLAAFAGALFVWILAALPETMHPEDRLPLSPGRILSAFRVVLTNRFAVGYILAMTVMMGSVFGFVTCAQQVFADVFHMGALFPMAFAVIGVAMALSSLLNARIVGKLGSRRVSHAALLGFTAFAGIHLAVALAGRDTFWTFVLLQAATMFCFGLVGANFSAMAMQPMGHVAGTASSVQGFVSTLGGSVLGILIGQAFDGTTRPLTLAFFGLGLVALAIVLTTEGGRLFVAREAPVKAP